MKYSIQTNNEEKRNFVFIGTVTKNGMMEEDIALGFPFISDMMDRSLEVFKRSSNTYLCSGEEPEP